MIVLSNVKPIKLWHALLVVLTLIVLFGPMCFTGMSNCGTYNCGPGNCDEKTWECCPDSSSH